MQIDQHPTRCREGRVELDRVGEKTCDLLFACACLCPQLGYCEERPEVLRIGGEQLVEALARLLGLLVAQVERRQAGGGRVVERVDAQRALEALARGGGVLECHLDLSPQLRRERFSRLLALQLVDRL